MGKVLIELRDVKKYFPVTKGLIFMHQIGGIKAVDGVSFTIDRGQTFGLVGESGCGKTTTTRLILLLEKITGGTIFFDDKDITKLSGAELKKYRASVQAVFQDPFRSLNPRMQVGDIIAEPLVVNHALPKKAIKERITELLAMVGLRSDAAKLYPHEFSGGQRQRIAVARALAPNPKLIVFDEPVSALDVSIRAQILNLLHDIQQTTGITCILIAHDLAVVKHMSDRVGVMYLGKIVERAETEELYLHPIHPYTQALLSAALPFHPDRRGEEIILSGEMPSLLNLPPGCRFHHRCSRAKRICLEEEPPLKEVINGHLVACHA